VKKKMSPPRASRAPARAPSRLAAAAPLDPAGETSPLTRPVAIEALAARAYLWGLAPEYAYRFSTLNTLLLGPCNTLISATVPAAWNNAAVNAGNPAILYVTSFIDFATADALVLTVPPSSESYYVVQLLDTYLNTYASIGTRTTPSDVTTYYLLVGPSSPWARQTTAVIGGFTFPVVASDTDLDILLVRVAANTLSGADDPRSVPSITTKVVERFALNTLGDFQANGNQPIYTADVTYSPTARQVKEATLYQNSPTQAVEFFTQLGKAVMANPVPSASTGLSGMALSDLPPWVVPQYGAKTRYVVPSHGQERILRSFAPLGLNSATGFKVPSNWGNAQLSALQAGYTKAQKALKTVIGKAAATSSTNYWSILNDLIGTYPSNLKGYAIRSGIVLNGGFANIPLDGVYPSTASSSTGADLDGNITYAITFAPPLGAQTTLPVVGIVPPLVTGADHNPEGFWSLTLYQPDPTEAAAPFLSQASVLNTSYSSASTAVVSVDAATSTLTVLEPDWGTLKASTPILFGANAPAFGLTAGTVYYVAGTPVAGVDPASGKATFSLQVSAQWIQTLSAGNVPIQNSGGPGPISSLMQPPASAGALMYGPIKPVSQLGSAELCAGQLALNADGSLTLWLSPSLPPNVSPSNWIPSPSTAYFQMVYPGKTVSTALQVILRMYYPTPGNMPPSILPYSAGSQDLKESYVPPALVGGSVLAGATTSVIRSAG
jgi:hypothetical protein